MLAVFRLITNSNFVGCYTGHQDSLSTPGSCCSECSLNIVRISLLLFMDFLPSREL